MSLGKVIRDNAEYQIGDEFTADFSQFSSLQKLRQCRVIHIGVRHHKGDGEWFERYKVVWRKADGEWSTKWRWVYPAKIISS